nr:leucine-rich repeat-containing protein 45-like isoform X5 [Physcomitrium patens]|eukprot:XP_024391772.1 leucine-rich repeat-containing protein 45-like isoform X5 [Physcomitrella patens]
MEGHSKFATATLANMVQILFQPETTSALATIVNAVKNNDKLAELDLSGCCIQKGDALAELVRNSPSLQRLLLAWNSLGSARTGIAALAFAVASAPSLRELDLRSNRIGPATAAALALALRSNNTLKRIDLTYNEVGTSGATALLGMLEKNHFLTELKLAGNNIPCQLLGQIDSLLQKNRARHSMTEDCDDLAVTPEICGDAGSRVSDLRTARHSQSQCWISTFPEAKSAKRASSTRISGRSTAQNSNKIIQDELEMLRKILGDAKAECDDLYKQKCDTVCQLEASREELDKEIKRRGKVQRETEELKTEIAKLKQEIGFLQDKLHCNACETYKKIDILEKEITNRKESERVAQEREAEGLKEIQHLTDQLTTLQEDSIKRIHAMEAKYKSEAKHNAVLINKLESSISQRDLKQLEEIEAVRSQSEVEIDSLKSIRDDLIMEVEKQKGNTKLCEQQLVIHKQVLQQEKEAIEQELKLQIKIHVVKIECLENQLEEKDKENAKIKQKHGEHVQALEDDLRKERASVTRAGLIKSDAEQKIATMEADMELWKEKYKAEQEGAMFLEEKIRADELKFYSCVTALCSKNAEEQEMMKGDLCLQRKKIETMHMQHKEMQAEHDRRMKDVEIQLRGTETAVVEWVQQQFSALLVALSFHASLPAIKNGSVWKSHFNRGMAIEGSDGAEPRQTRSACMSENQASSPLSPRKSQTCQPTDATSTDLPPMASQSNLLMARLNPAPVVTKPVSPSSQSNTKANPPASGFPSTTQLMTDKGPRPGLASSRSSRMLVDYTCSAPSLSVISLVQPVLYEEVGTVEEDLVSSDRESVNSDEM